MTKAQRDILRKKRVLEHAERIGNIRRTCRYFGVARSAFYLWKQAYETYGEEGLVNKKPCPVNLKLRTAPEIVEKVLYLRRTYHLGPISSVWYLERYHGMKISDAGVYRVLRRNGLNRLPRRVGRRAVHTHRYAKQVPGHHVQVDVTFLTLKGKDGRNIRLAFEHARKHGRKRVTLVTKANVVKTTDGRFLRVGYEIAKEYPEIECDDWYIDIMTAKLVDEKRRRDFEVLALPNLYGDILTDEAAEFQGGVGTAGSANIGKRYAMFEAIHGSAPRMVKEGRAQYADLCSMIRAGAMLVGHVGYPDKQHGLEMALDICGQYEKKLVMTGRDTGSTGHQYAEYLMQTLKDPKLEERHRSYQTSR
jgi:transposase